MAGYQFFHVECYGREESNKEQTIAKKKSDGTFSSKEVAKKKVGSVRTIIAEAKREEGNCPHIDSPKPPTVLLGDLDQVEQEATKWAEQTTDAKGRKLRNDAHCLLAGVISLPRAEEEDWPKFRDRSIKWLKEKYGDNLRCVVEHQDESHPHIHFYCIAKIGQSFDDLHEGKRAQKELKKQNPQATKKDQNLAFSEAMRETQDEFSRRVGQHFGLARLGPGRRRLTRAEWQAEQKQAEMLQKAKDQKESYKKLYKKEAIKEAQPLIAQAKEQAKEEGLAEAKSFGERVGGWWASAKEKFSGPTEREEQAIKEANEARARAEDEARRAKNQADNRVTNVADLLRKEQDKVASLEKDLDRAQDKIQELKELIPASQQRNRKNLEIK